MEICFAAGKFRPPTTLLTLCAGIDRGNSDIYFHQGRGATNRFGVSRGVIVLETVMNHRYILRGSITGFRIIPHPQNAYRGVGVSIV